MKFNCGLTKEAKEKAKEAKQEAKHEYLSTWHKWFAWYPVKLGNHDCRWLEYVERKGEYCESYYYDSSDYWDWEYKEIEKQSEHVEPHKPWPKE